MTNPNSNPNLTGEKQSNPNSNVGVLGITRSHTVDAFKPSSSSVSMANAPNPKTRSIKLSRNLSNNDILKSTEAPLLQRSRSIDTNDLELNNLSNRFGAMNVEYGYAAPASPSPMLAGYDPGFAVPPLPQFAYATASPQMLPMIPPTPQFGGFSVPPSPLYDPGHGHIGYYGHMMASPSFSPLAGPSAPMSFNFSPLHNMHLPPNTMSTGFAHQQQPATHRTMNIRGSSNQNQGFSNLRSSQHQHQQQHQHQSSHNQQLHVQLQGNYDMENMANLDNLNEINLSATDVMLEELRVVMKGSAGPTAHSTAHTHAHAKFKQFPAVAQGVQWGLPEIRGKALEFSKDQFGSRFLQQQLADPTVSQALKDDLFEELQPLIPALCKDVFGNYVIQKLLEVDVGTAKQHNAIVEIALRGRMFDLARHMYGCRVVQKLVEQIFSNGQSIVAAAPETAHMLDVYTHTAQNVLLQELGADVVTLVFDQNGNHVVQKCIEVVRPLDRVKQFFEAFQGQYLQMSTHSYGCRVVQRVLETQRLGLILQVVKEIMTEAPRLIIDSYANYVIQHVLENHCNYESFMAPSAVGGLATAEKEYLDQLVVFRRTLFDIVAANVLQFSQHKFGSNVVECCIKSGSPAEKEILIRKTIEPNTLVHMMKDPYANYVVQKVIDAANNNQLANILVVVEQNEPMLRRLTYGKHILNKLKMHSNGLIRTNSGVGGVGGVPGFGNGLNN